MSDSLTQMIDALVLEKTVSLDALNAINALKQQAALLDGQLRAADDRQMKDAALIRELRDQIADLSNQHKQVVALLDQANKRVEAATKVEQEGKDAKAELRGFINAMQMVFKPAVVRETIQKTVPLAVEGNRGGNGSYSSPGFVTQSTETGTIERSAE